MKYNRAMTDVEGQGSEGVRTDTARVVFHAHAYDTLMEEARAAMPGETVGLLFGTARANSNGQYRITVKEITPVRLAGRDNTLGRRVNGPKLLLERATARGHGLKMVGWFYADPGTGIFSPRISLEEIQRNLPDSSSLFLLVNPSTDQGAFYSWNGRQYVPNAGFDETPLDESATPLVGWDGGVRGAARWFGDLLADLPSDTIPIGHDEISQWVQPAVPATVGERMAAHNGEDRQSTSASDDDSGPPSASGGASAGRAEESGLSPSPGQYGDHPVSSAPIFVEVITEEPVEYLAPELTVTTGELTPLANQESEAASISTQTQPYPILSGESDEEYEPIVADMPGPLQPGRSLGAGKVTGPLGTEQATVPEDDASAERRGYGPATRKLETPDDAEPQTEHSFLSSPQRATHTPAHAALVPVTRSLVHPVMKQRGWSEVLHVLSGLLVVAVIAVLLLAGLAAQQDNTRRSVPRTTEKPGLVQSGARAGDNAGPVPVSTRLPTISGATGTTITAVVTATISPALPGVEK